RSKISSMPHLTGSPAGTSRFPFPLSLEHDGHSHSTAPRWSCSQLGLNPKPVVTVERTFCAPRDRSCLPLRVWRCLDTLSRNLLKERLLKTRLAAALLLGFTLAWGVLPASHMYAASSAVT